MVVLNKFKSLVELSADTSIFAYQTYYSIYFEEMGER